MGTLLGYLTRRVWALLLTLVVVVTLNFVLVRTAPGDPVRILAGMDQPSPELVEALTRRYGLDQPLPAQFAVYVGSLLRGDLGRSITFERPVSDLIAQTLGPTLLLTLTATLLAFGLGVGLGTLAGARVRSRLDGLLSLGAYTLYAMPPFWLGMMAILVFASWLGWLPTSGMYDVRQPQAGPAHWLDVARHLVLPAATLALVQMPVFYRVTRASVVQVLNDDFVTTLTAAGLRQGVIFRRYVLKNALLPAVTMLGLQLGYVLAGAALVEVVFAWPGMGRLTLNAIYRRDFPLVMGIYLVVSTSVALGALITDLVYSWLDPRIRYG
ncbi:MAG TPA: ABC transporter permease [Bacillota bacterium]